MQQTALRVYSIQSNGLQRVDETENEELWTDEKYLFYRFDNEGVPIDEYGYEIVTETIDEFLPNPIT